MLFILFKHHRKSQRIRSLDNRETQFAPFFNHYEKDAKFSWGVICGGQWLIFEEKKEIKEGKIPRKNLEKKRIMLKDNYKNFLY